MQDIIILGVLQGLFEWVPISSEGVVVLASQLFTTDFNPVDTALFLHLGTLLAALVYFKKDWKEVLTFKDPNLFRFLTIATIISLFIGFALYNLIKNIIFGPGLLMLMGVGLLFTAYFQKRKISLNMGRDRMAVLVGLLQGLAVIPGLSRSGSTIFGLSLGRFTPQEILKISYMLSVPAVFASSAFLLIKNTEFAVSAWPAIVVAFVVGLLSLDFLLRVAQKINFSLFTFIFGLLCLLGGVIGIII